jgi:DNA-binding transcriptional ArsR family regulator
MEMAILRALGSPVRQEILDQLARGPATSAMVARALGSNTGVTSYHLRELAKAGLITQDDRRGRSLFWRLADDDVRFRDPQTSPDPRGARAAIDVVMTRFTTSVSGYLHRGDLDAAWRDASLFSQSALTLTVDELAAFGEAYLEFLKAWRSRPPAPAQAGPRPVRVALFAYPEDVPSAVEG